VQVAHAGTSDDGVWRRLYLAVLAWILVGFGVLGWIGVSPGGLLSGRRFLVPVGLGLGGLVAATVGPVAARVALGAISGFLALAGLGWVGLLWTVAGLSSPETVSAVAIVATGVSGLSLAATWPRRGSVRPASSSGTGQQARPAPAERWWQTRWWLMVVVTGFPFAFGISASLLAMLAAPSTPGCGESAERVLVASANGLAARVGGLHLGELGGCDSGDPAAIEWEHASLSGLRASATAAGCRDAYLEDWDVEYSFMVCGEGPTQLILTIEPDQGESGATGSISLNS
jgi:hypothetical protein